MDKFDSNYIQAGSFGGKDYVLIQYVDNMWGILIREKYGVEKVPRRFINRQLAKDAINDILAVEKRKVELANENIQQLSLF